MQIQSKVFVLTGAARIGIDVGQTLLAAMAKLAVIYFSNKPDLGPEVFYVKADLSNPEEVASAIKQIKQHFGQIDGLIHMAANYERTSWDQLSDEAWRKSMKAIAKSAFLMAKAAGDEIKNRPEGRMIFMADWSVMTQPYKDYLIYNMAKAAVEGLTKSLAKELAPKILVNAIAPGPILKPADLSDEDNTEVLKNTPLERWGGAHEITKAIMFLIDSDFVTGQIFYVDGGRSIA